MSSHNPYGVPNFHNTVQERPLSTARNNLYNSTVLPQPRVDSANIQNRSSSANAAAGSNYSSKQQQQQYQRQQQNSASPQRQQQKQQQYQQNPQHSQQIQRSHLVNNREDSLEYFIKFPTTTTYRNDGASSTEVNDSDFIYLFNETNVPIVMLLGWAGCQDRYLMKYSKIYEDRGLITVRYTAPVDTLFWKRTAMMPIGEKILKLIYDMNFDTHPVIFHIFSNGGAYLYQHITLAMRKYNTPLQIRGIIFDSAPGERRLLGLYRAISAIYGKEKRKCNSLTAIIITLTLGVMWFVEETLAVFKSLFVKTKPLQTNPFNDLKNEANSFPQMFLYSKADDVIPYQDVEKFIRIRQQKCVPVSSACFEDAEHVKIFSKYPTQYIRCVCAFINKCLALPYNEDYAQGMLGDDDAAAEAAYSNAHNSGNGASNYAAAPGEASNVQKKFN